MEFEPGIVQKLELELELEPGLELRLEMRLKPKLEPKSTKAKVLKKNYL